MTTTPDWLKRYLKAVDLTAARVDVVWEGTHVALLKKKRPASWLIIDKVYTARHSPAQQVQALEVNIYAGRLSPPDLARLLAQVKALDARYPSLIEAQKEREAGRQKRIEDKQKRAQQQERVAQKRADELCKLLRRAKISFHRTDNQVYEGAIKIALIQVVLDGGIIRFEITSQLNGFKFSQVRFSDLRDGLLDPKDALKIVAAIAKLRLPKGVRE